MARRKVYNKLSTGENDKSMNQTSPSPDDKTIQIPRGYHTPPPGYIDNANRYLWNYEPRSSPPCISFEAINNDVSEVGTCLQFKLDSIASTNSGQHNENVPCERKKRSKLTSPLTLPYITPPNSPIGRRNIAPLGIDEFDYHQTFDKSCRSTLILSSMRNNFNSLSTYLRGRLSPSTIIAVGFVFAASFGFFMEYSMVQPHTRETQILHRIVEKGISLQEKLTTSGSAQFKALRWILEEDPRRLDHFDEEIFARYSIAVIYYFMAPFNAEGLHWNPLSGQTVCNWEGVLCSHSANNNNPTVIGLNISNVQGHLPGMELSALVSIF